MMRLKAFLAAAAGGLAAFGSATGQPAPSGYLMAPPDPAQILRPAPREGDARDLEDKRLYQEALSDPELRLHGIVKALLPPELGLYRLSHHRADQAHQPPDFHAWSEHWPEHWRVVVLSVSPMTYFNTNSVEDLRDVIEKMHAAGRELVIAGISPKQYKVLERGGLTDVLDVENFCPDLEFAIARGLELVRQRVHETQQIGIGVPRAETNFRLARLRDELHRRHPPLGRAIHLPPTLAGRLNEEKIPQLHAGFRLAVIIRALATVRQIEMQRHVRRLRTVVPANQIHTRYGMTQHTLPSLLERRANAILARPDALNTIRVTRRAAILGNRPGNLLRPRGKNTERCQDTRDQDEDPASTRQFRDHD